MCSEAAGEGSHGSDPTGDQLWLRSAASAALDGMPNEADASGELLDYVLSAFHHEEYARGLVLIPYGTRFCVDTRQQSDATLERLHNVALALYESSRRHAFKAIAGQGVYIKAKEPMRIIVDVIESTARALGILDAGDHYEPSGKAEIKYVSSSAAANGTPPGWNAVDGVRPYAVFVKAYEQAMQSLHMPPEEHPWGTTVHCDLDRNVTFHGKGVDTELVDGEEHASKMVVDARAVTCLYGVAIILKSVPRLDEAGKHMPGKFDVQYLRCFSNRGLWHVPVGLTGDLFAWTGGTCCARGTRTSSWATRA